MLESRNGTSPDTHGLASPPGSGRNRRGRPGDRIQSAPGRASKEPFGSGSVTVPGPPTVLGGGRHESSCLLPPPPSPLGRLVHLSACQQIALSTGPLLSLTWSGPRSTSHFDYIASCHQIDMSSNHLRLSPLPVPYYADPKTRFLRNEEVDAPGRRRKPAPTKRALHPGFSGPRRRPRTVHQGGANAICLGGDLCITFDFSLSKSNGQIETKVHARPLGALVQK